jgi:hypothetical protein
MTAAIGQDAARGRFVRIRFLSRDWAHDEEFEHPVRAVIRPIGIAAQAGWSHRRKRRWLEFFQLS